MNEIAFNISIKADVNDLAVLSAEQQFAFWAGIAQVVAVVDSNKGVI